MQIRGLSSSGGWLVLTMTGLVATAPGYAQIELLHANGPIPSFEVATIKPSVGNTPPTTGELTINATTKVLIQSAYQIPIGSAGRVVGGPAWINSDTYAIQAKISDELRAKLNAMSASDRGAQVDLMEQSLLADRFKLKAHFETREMPIYELVVVKGGPKITAAKTLTGESNPSPGAGTNVPAAFTQGIRIRRTEHGMELTAKGETLQDWLKRPTAGINDRPIVDKTGLTGRYDFTLDWTPSQDGTGAAGNAAPPNDGPSIFTALEEQLGLKLVPAKGPVEVIVIDRIERPSPN